MTAQKIHPLKPDAETLITAQRILVRDLILPCHIGVSAKERSQLQRLCFNLELELVPKAPHKDQIDETVHYGHLVEKLRKVCDETKVKLIETLAEHIAAACFFDSRVLQTRVRIEKLDRYGDIGGIGIEIERRRQSS